MDGLKGNNMISIIIPAYNQHEITQECVRAIIDHTKDYEIILVDNGSKPPIAGANIRNEKNLGFPAAVNQGIRAGFADDIIILLNNDVIVTPGWADYLKIHLEQYAIVSPLTNYCAGLQRVTLPLYENREELDRVACENAVANKLQTREVNWIIGFCMAFRKSLWEELGEFDESLWPCSGEEIDFCLRARKSGHKIGIARDVYVHHAGSQTFRDLQTAGEIEYNKIVDRNNAHLAQKWGESWVRQAA